ncbi:MAG: ABC transporter permease [candidate division Zixibacteria bacterium]|nr:ABC transporter permease [candidate division Zixibacteria bacterium]
MNKIRFIAGKELRHILRDPRSLFVAILLPIIMTLLYGYAVTLDIKEIKLAVCDYDCSRESRDLVARFYHSGYFVKAGATDDLLDPESVLESGKANLVLTIPPGFAVALKTWRPCDLGLMIDGADANLAAAASNYSNAILQSFLKEYLPPGTELPGVTLSQQVLYNPDLKSSHFFVPGLIAIILMMISALLTSITIAREKETGTMEQLLTAPVTPRQIIIGKVLPYVGLALLDGLLVLLFAVFHFGVPFTGSFMLLLFFGVIYVVAALSLGVLISTLVSTQQVAIMAALTVTVLPSVMLSGFIFEIRNMPVVLQYISYLVPARYFLLIIRGVMLKGSGIGVLWIEAVFLVGLAVAMLTIAAKRFKLKLE